MPKKFKSFLKKISTGAVKYQDPRTIKPSIVDKEVRKAVITINKSSWCWTLWSCQGHIYSDECTNLPYLTFVVKKKYKEELLGLLFSTLPPYKDKEFPIVPNVDIKFDYAFFDKKYCVMSVVWAEKFLYDDYLINFLYNRLEKVAKIIKKKHK